MASNEQTNFAKIEMNSTNQTNPTMTSKMNDQTHKVIVAKYVTFQYFAVPIDWELHECDIEYGSLTRNGIESSKCIKDEVDYRNPEEISIDPLSEYFSCDEDSDDEED